MAVLKVPEPKQVTVAELIEMLGGMPQDAPVFVEADYGVHHCDGVRSEGGKVYVVIG